MLFSSMAYGQHISTQSNPSVGDIYYLGGNIGFGTTFPEQLLELKDESSVSLRLRKTNPSPLCGYTFWDITNEGSLKIQRKVFSCANPTGIETKMLLTPSGRLALGSESPHSSAIFQADATDRGILIPHLTDSEMNAIAAPANGLLIYNTDNNAFAFYQTDTWVNVTENSQLDDYLLITDFESHPAYNISTQNTIDWQATYTEIDNLETNTLIYNNISGTLTSIPDGTDQQVLTTNGEGNYTWQTIEEAMPDVFWERDNENNNTYLLNQNDKVGLGTSNPKTPLHIQSSEEEGANIRLSIKLNNHTDQPPQSNNYKFWDFKNEGNNLKINFGMIGLAGTTIENKFTFNSNGNIGIGTENPTKQIHIVSEQTPTMRLEKYSEGGIGVSKPQIWDIELKTSSLSFNYYEGDSEIIFHNNGKIEANQLSIADDNFIVNAQGKVGIGTNSPNEKLEVDGSIATNNIIGNSTNNYLQIISPDNHTNGGSYFKLYGNQTSGSISAVIGEGGEYNIYRYSGGWNSLFKITEEGNIGIGTTTPSAKLEVNGEISAESISFEFTEPFEINTNGGSNQTSLLSVKNIINGDIEENTTADIDFYLWDNNCQLSTPQARIGVVGSDEQGQDYDAGGRLVFYTTTNNYNNPNLHERMIITPEGKVGIGKNNPSQKLDVAGSISTNGFDIYLKDDDNHGLGWYGHRQFALTNIDGPVLYGYYRGALGTRYTNNAENIALSWNKDGRVGIGTTSPTAQLEIKQTENNNIPMFINAQEMLDWNYALQIRVESWESTQEPEKIKAIGIIDYNNHEQYRVMGNGEVYARKVTVKVGSFKDYVFFEDYPLLPLPELEAFINKHFHLPEVPSEAEVIENGLDLGGFSATLLQKIEELTLYTIEQDKQIKDKEQKIELLQTQLNEQQKQINQLFIEIQNLKQK